MEARTRQIRNLAAATEQEYEKEKLNERIARLSGGVAIIQARTSEALLLLVVISCTAQRYLEH